VIPLVLRSNYSLMWGTASVYELCCKAKKLGYTELALTDTDNLCALICFLDACRKFDLTPIVGAEITDPGKGVRAVCLVKNRKGYGNLCKLITKRHQDNGFQLKTDLPEYGDGLIVLTNNADYLKYWYTRELDLGAALYRKPVPLTHALAGTAKQLNIPLVATPGSFFLNPGDGKMHKMLRAIDRNSTFSRLCAKDIAPDDAYLAPPSEYEKRFAICPESLQNSHALAEKLEFRGPDFGIVMPLFRNEANAEKLKQILSRKVYQGAKTRYGSVLLKKIRTRIEYELKIITRMNFTSYFLVVHDIIQKSPRICGRGSGAASIVAYCLGITNVCPVKFNLYFERFLNPGRSDPPDIDIDFAWDERDKVLAAVFDKFKNHAAMVSSHVLFQPPMAIRESAKVFGLAEAEINRVSKRLPWFWKKQELELSLMERIKQRKEFQFMDFPDPWPEIMEYAEVLVSNPRYLSVHPGGIVITPGPINEYVPIETAKKGVPVMQWDKDAAEDAGLVKIDLLGNRSLGVIRDAVNNIRGNNIEFNESGSDPEDDPETRQVVARGDTMGCFYIESPAMRLLQKKAKTGDFQHLVIHSSIIRPAANEYIQEYLKRLHGQPWDPIHPLLEDVLKETFGIMVYQEDVSRVAVRFAGFNHAEADGLRKILSKKNKALQLKDYYKRFHAGAKERGVKDEQIKLVWNMILSFDGYSFCKPHSASYARVSFQAAYLKTHFPAEFMAAVISNQGGFYSTFAYVSEAVRMGLKVLRPDVNKSNITWLGKNNEIRTGLLSIKNLSLNTRQKIIMERSREKFKDIHDFLGRVNPADDEAKALIHSGAFDSFNQNGSKSRADLLWILACRLRYKSAVKTGESSTLFGSLQDHIRFPNFPRESRIARLRREYAVLGFLCECHPIVLYKNTIKRIKSVKACNTGMFVNKIIRFAGWLITGKTVLTRGGDPMKFLTFEDETGIMETVFFPKTYACLCHMLEYGRPYLLTGKVESDWGAVTMSVINARRLTQGHRPGNLPGEKFNAF